MVQLPGGPGTAFEPCKGLPNRFVAGIPNRHQLDRDASRNVAVPAVVNGTRRRACQHRLQLIFVNSVDGRAHVASHKPPPTSTEMAATARKETGGVKICHYRN